MDKMTCTYYNKAGKEKTIRLDCLVVPPRKDTLFHYN